jgi:hypothetical protein
LYIWLVWKSWTLNQGQHATIPIQGDGGLTQQLGSKAYSRERDFLEKLSKWLAEVKAWWVAVGTAVARCPPRGSPRATFPHGALILDE